MDLGGTGKQQRTNQSRNRQFYGYVSEWMDLEVSERIDIVVAAQEADGNGIDLVREHQQPTKAGSDKREPLGIPLGWCRPPAPHVVLISEENFISIPIQSAAKGKPSISTGSHANYAV